MVAWLNGPSLIALGQILAIVASGALSTFLYFKSRNDKRGEKQEEKEEKEEAAQRLEFKNRVIELERVRRQGDAFLHERIDKFQGRVYKEHKRMGSTNAVIDRRLSVLEKHVEGLPTHADLTGLRSDMAQMGADVSAIKERSETALGLVHSIHDHLLEKRK